MNLFSSMLRVSTEFPHVIISAKPLPALQNLAWYEEGPRYSCCQGDCAVCCELWSRIHTAAIVSDLRALCAGQTFDFARLLMQHADYKVWIQRSVTRKVGLLQLCNKDKWQELQKSDFLKELETLESALIDDIKEVKVIIIECKLSEEDLRGKGWIIILIDFSLSEEEHGQVSVDCETWNRSIENWTRLHWSWHIPFSITSNKYQIN